MHASTRPSHAPKSKLDEICTVSWRGREPLKDARAVAAQAAPHVKPFYAHLRSFVCALKSPRRGTRIEACGLEPPHPCAPAAHCSVQNKPTTYTLLVILTVDGSSHEKLLNQQAIRDEQRAGSSRSTLAWAA